MEGFEPEAKNIQAEEEARRLKALNIHTSDLHDQNEDMAGEIIDLATGQRIDNTKEEGNDEILPERHVDSKDPSEDVMGSLPRENDAAEQWLKENDPKRRKAA